LPADFIVTPGTGSAAGNCAAAIRAAIFGVALLFSPDQQASSRILK
jgi:hypothetical protein